MNDTTPTQPHVPTRPRVKPPSILLLGEAGTGKTYSIPTLLASGLEVFVLVTEANGVDTLLDSLRDKDLPIDKLHWHVVSPVAPGWGALSDMANTVSSMGYEDIQKIKSGVGKAHTRQFVQLLNAFRDFPCDRTGQCFGDVTTWDDSRVLVIDSLSGINSIAMDHTIGYKPSAHQGEWGVAMNLQEKLFLTLTNDCWCFLVTIGHVDKEMNEITGIQVITASALGRKNAPKLQKMFSEIVLAKRDRGTFRWSTSETNVAVKNRALPISDALEPNFTRIVDAHKARLKQASEGNAIATPNVAAPPAA